MQGWRMSQEDAHNCESDLCDGCSLFAVYDGHGGCEVARYTAQQLPGALSSCPRLARGRVHTALRRVFSRHDASLTQPHVVARLKEIAARDGSPGSNDSDEEGEDYAGEVDQLYHEAHMPLDELISQRYSGPTAGGDTAPEGSNRPRFSGASQLSRVRAALKSANKPPVSPFLRSKQNAEAISSGTNDNGTDTVSTVKSEDQDQVQRSLSSEISDAGKGGSPPTKPKLEKASNDVILKSDDVTGDDQKTNGVSNGKEHHDSANGDVAEKQKLVEDASVKAADSNGVVNGDHDTVETDDSASAGEKHDSAPASDVPVKGPRPGSTKTPLGAGQASLAGSRRGANVQQTRGPRRLMPARRAAAAIGEMLEDDEDSDEDEQDHDFSLSTHSDDSVLSAGLDDTEDEEDEDSDEDADDAEDDESGDEFDESCDGVDSSNVTEDSDDEDEEDGLAMGDEESSNFMMSMKNEPGSDSGCTASVALLYGSHLFVANIGDSRCVLARGSRAIDMSEDHKPEDAPERSRIEAAGGRVTMDGRVNGGLNLSRAFGDHAYKTNTNIPADQQMISASPDVRHIRLKTSDETEVAERDRFLVVACDGIWNSMTSQQVVDFVGEWLDKPEEEQISLSAICEKLFDECLAPDTKGDGTGCDNMTCIIVKFKPSLQTRVPPAEPQRVSDAADVSIAAADDDGDESDESGDEGSARAPSKSATSETSSPSESRAETELPVKRPPSDRDTNATSCSDQQPPEKRARIE